MTGLGSADANESTIGSYLEAHYRRDGEPLSTETIAITLALRAELVAQAIEGHVPAARAGDQIAALEHLEPIAS